MCLNHFIGNPRQSRVGARMSTGKDEDLTPVPCKAKNVVLVSRLTYSIFTSPLSTRQVFFPAQVSIKCGSRKAKNRALSGPRFLRPCSQSCRVRTEIPKRSANSPWDIPLLFRKARRYFTVIFRAPTHGALIFFMDSSFTAFVFNLTKRLSMATIKAGNVNQLVAQNLFPFAPAITPVLAIDDEDRARYG